MSIAKHKSHHCNVRNVELDSNLGQQCNQTKHNIVNCITPAVQIIATHVHDKAWRPMFLDDKMVRMWRGFVTAPPLILKKFDCGRSSILKTLAEACLLSINAPKRFT